MVDPRIAFSFFGIQIHWYGILIACGLAAGAILGIREARRRGYRSEMILDFLLVAIPICIICARIYYVIFTWSEYSNNLLNIFAVWEGGLAIYGAVVGGILAAFIFYKWRGVSIGEMLDIAAPSIVIGQAIGRWGNFVNQEAFGNLVSNPSLQWFPYSVYIQRLGEWHQATFFYESMWDLITFIILMLFRKKIKTRGGVFALYVIFYGFGRFWIESQRSDSLMLGNVRVSQLLSAILVVCGIIYLFVMSRRKLEYPVYDGLYSIGWSEDKIRHYKDNIKKIKADQYAQTAEKKAEDIADEYGPESEKAKKAHAIALYVKQRAESIKSVKEDDDDSKDEDNGDDK